MNNETLMQAWLRTARCDLLRAFRQRSDIITPLVFFIIVASLFPLGVGPEPETLRIMAPGVILVAALLATLLSLQRLFGHELNDGTLEQLVLSSQPLSVLISAKVFIHWLTTGLPLVVISPLLCIQLGLSGDALLMTIFSLLLGTPILSLIGAIGAALTLGLRGGGVLLALLILPLYIPVLIFASSAIVASANGFPTEAQLSLLAAYLCIGLIFALWACAASLRISLD